jgi:hypothetical protein
MNEARDDFDPGQVSWESMVRDFERKLDVLSAALQDVRQAGRRLAQMQLAFGADEALDLVAPLNAALEEDPAHLAPAVLPALEPPAEMDPREEVRRTVEQARQDLETGGRMAAVGWTMPRDFWPGVGTAADQPEPVQYDTDPARDAVRQAVEEAKAELARGDLEPSEPAVPQPATGFASWTGAALGDPASTSTPEQNKAPNDELSEDERREQVRLAVERARLEMEAANAPGFVDTSLAAEVEAEEEARREEVRRAVESARAEMSWSLTAADEQVGEAAASGGNEDDEDARREEVRRAVELARSEMSSGLYKFDESSPPEANGLLSVIGGTESANTPTWQQNKEVELAGLPASIVIEDPIGRVELARVYETLSHIGRASASLMNYTPHSVTVGLAAMEPLPEGPLMTQAIQAAFGRSCRITTDGNRMSVKIVNEAEKAA